MNEIQFLKNKFYICILNGNLEFIDFIDYGYVQNYIFYFVTIFHATLYGGMLGNFAEGSAPAHTVLLPVLVVYSTSTSEDEDYRRTAYTKVD